ncbi:MAG TPA: polysaccharide biosynthesis/export family protein [Pyrinomonadaceae bacterium]|nr:polysaccharide biosynthesis/export family protein [Pyrinomonadaceae bacterium]
MIMKKTLPIKFIAFAFITAFGTAAGVTAQTEQGTVKKVNFGYSQNPKTKPKSPNSDGANKAEVVPETEIAISAGENKIDVNSANPAQENKEFESRSVASKTLEVVKKANKNAVSPTEIYKVGVGDVLFISLQNAPAKASTYFTVLNDGSIDYPLAGEMISVTGMTTDEIEDLLKEKIKLFENPQVSVKVREHASHAITVLGLVEKAGEKYLPREAVPLFMIRAEAIVQPRASFVVIKRANSETEQVNLKDAQSDEILIFPGDILEFKAADGIETTSAAQHFYYIGGKIPSAGKKDFHPYLTLWQAILDAGGLKVKKVIIRRKNEAGLLTSTEYDLNQIKNGKQPDPLIKAGDTIEIVN